MPDIISILLSPCATLQRIKSSPRWISSFAFLAGVSIVVSLCAHPSLVTATLAHLPPSATADEKELVARALDNELPIRCFFLPVRLLVGWSSFAFVLFSAGKALGTPEPLQFIKVFSLEVRAEIFNILAQVASLVMLIIRRDTNMTGLIPLSGAAFVSTNNIVTFSLLNSLNFFTLVYVAILTIGISLQSGCSYGKSFAIALVGWLTYLLFQLGMMHLMGDTMHFLI